MLSRIPPVSPITPVVKLNLDLALNRPLYDTFQKSEPVVTKPYAGIYSPAPSAKRDPRDISIFNPAQLKEDSAMSVENRNAITALIQSEKDYLRNLYARLDQTAFGSKEESEIRRLTTESIHNLGSLMAMRSTH
jgi:hypothetical protein